MTRIYSVLILSLAMNLSLAQNSDNELELILPIGHTSEIDFISWSSDQSKIITAGRDNCIVVWDINTGNPIVRAQADFQEYGWQRLRFTHDIELVQIPINGKYKWLKVNENKYVDKSEIPDFDNLIIKEIYRRFSDFENPLRFSADSGCWIANGQNMSEKVNSPRGDGFFKVNQIEKSHGNKKWGWFGREIEYIPQGAKNKKWKLKVKDKINHAVWSPKGEYIVVFSRVPNKPTFPIVINVSTGEIHNILKGKASGGFDLAYSKINNSVVACYLDGTARIWDLYSGKIKKTINCSYAHPTISSSWSENQNYFVVSSHDSISIYTKKGEYFQSYYHDRYIWNVDFLNNCDELLFSDAGSDFEENSVDFYSINLKTGTRQEFKGGHKLAFDPMNGGRAITSLVSNNHGSYIASGDRNGKMCVWAKIPEKKNKFEVIKEFDCGEGPVMGIFFVENKMVISATVSGTIKIWDIVDGNLKTEFTQASEIPTSIYLDKSNNELIINYFSGLTEIRNFSSLEVLKSYSNYSFSGLAVDIENKLLISRNFAEIQLSNIETGNLIASFISIDTTDYVTIIEDNYYYASPGAVNYLQFKVDNNTYYYDQFDLKLNRPDLVIKRLDPNNTSLIDAYHSAYTKRLKKLGFTEEMLKDDYYLPEIEIENFEEIPQLHNQGSIELDLKLHDSKYKLDRINVWVNDVAIYGTVGISLRDKDVQEYQTKIEVFLAKGKNKVQVSVLNQAGAESYKETFEIECTVGKDKPDLYLITIGESEYQQSDFNLTYAAKDAQDMVKLFEKNKFYKEVFSKTLINDQVTRENVLALRSFLEQADINDEVMIFIAGHGVLEANLDYYFATYDMDFMNPAERGLAYDDLESLLDGIKPLKKTLLIDACHSGEIDKEEVELAEADIEEEDEIQFRVVGSTASPKLGVQNTSELTKSLFTDLRKGTGATVISSAGGMEFAIEGDEWNNGLFTYCFINGIKSKEADINNDGEIWLSEIQQYVSQQVYELSGGRQQPTSRIENQTVDFRVW